MLRECVYTGRRRRRRRRRYIPSARYVFILRNKISLRCRFETGEKSWPLDNSLRWLFISRKLRAVNGVMRTCRLIGKPAGRTRLKNIYIYIKYDTAKMSQLYTRDAAGYIHLECLYIHCIISRDFLLASRSSTTGGGVYICIYSDPFTGRYYTSRSVCVVNLRKHTQRLIYVYYILENCILHRPVSPPYIQSANLRKIRKKSSSRSIKRPLKKLTPI